MAAQSARPAYRQVDIDRAIKGYRDADPATRAIIDKIVDGFEWRARQGVRLEWAGLLAGVVVALAVLGVGAYLVTRGHDVAGAFIAALDVVGLVTVFVTRSREK